MKPTIFTLKQSQNTVNSSLHGLVYQLSKHHNEMYLDLLEEFSIKQGHLLSDMFRLEGG